MAKQLTKEQKEELEAARLAEEARLLAEWMGIKPFKANKLISQILVTAPHPETGEVLQWAVSNINPMNATTPGRLAVGAFVPRLGGLDAGTVRLLAIEFPAVSV